MKNSLSNLFVDYFNKNNFSDLSKIEVLKTKDLKFGDYTTNLPLKISKDLGKAPMDVANEIRDFLIENFNSYFSEVTVTNPGFVNMFLTKDLLVENAINYFVESFKPNFNSIPKLKINYEYISANPTGDLHIGHARNAIVGDVVTRVLEYVGHNVDREYYVNDGGNQITILAQSVYWYLADLQNVSKEITKEEVGYHGKEIISFANKLNEDGFKLEGTETEMIESLKSVSGDYFLNVIKELLDKMNISKFDTWTSEKELLESGKVESSFERLKQSGDVYENEGATWLSTEKYGDDKDRVLVKTDGSLTYMVPDIANHINKVEKGYNLLINLWGKDHHGYEARIKAALTSLGYNTPIEIDYINMVQILNGSEVVKMSKRAGTSLRIKDILEEMELDVFKYFLISKNKEQEMEIDINIAQQNDLSNPFYYSQYANARINQILAKYEEENGSFEKLNKFTRIGEDEKERDLLTKIVEFEDAIVSINNDREPSVLINYLKDLSQTFNSYYNSCKVISEDIELSIERLNLMKSLKNLYSQIFNLLGITPINKI